jgi:transposase
MMELRWQIGRRSFSREFKLEAVRLVRARWVSVAQAVHDRDLHQNMLVREFGAVRHRRFLGRAR